MSECPPSNADCNKPIGSTPVGEPCSPCFASTPADVYELVQKLSAEVCALTTRLNNMYQLLGRTRNRLTTVEDTVNNLPDDEEVASAVGCGGLETTSEADAVLVCEDGAEKAMVPSGSPEHLVFCGGKVKKVPKGIQFYPLTTAQLVLTQTNMASNSTVVNLPEYPTDVCGPVWALFQSAAQSFPGGSGSATSVSVGANGQGVVTTGHFGDLSFAESTIKTTSAATTFSVTVSGSGSRNFNVTLIGYLY